MRETIGYGMTADELSAYRAQRNRSATAADSRSEKAESRPVQLSVLQKTLQFLRSLI